MQDDLSSDGQSLLFHQARTTLRGRCSRAAQHYGRADLKVFTERQIRRRESILAAARELLTRHGIEGLTMRKLAKESGVAPKTLYHQFGSKEKLLRTAVEERFRYYYRLIDEEEIAHGIDRLFFIIDTVAATTRQNLAYAKALAPLLSDGPGEAFTAIRVSTYRKAVDQIAEEGGFVSWVDVELLAAVIYRQINPIYMASWLTSASWDLLPKVTKYEVCLILDSVTRGYTRKVAVETVRKMQSELHNKVHNVALK